VRMYDMILCSPSPGSLWPEVEGKGEEERGEGERGGKGK
jgi:hypothetical protein